MIVVDTNIIAYRWLPSPQAAAAEALTRLDPSWAAPLLWRSEFRNVLAGYLRAGKMTEGEAGRVLVQAAEALLGQEHVVSDHAVLKLVARSRCTAYDCEFVALAQALDAVLVTEDPAVLLAFPRQCRSLAQSLRVGVAL